MKNIKYLILATLLVSASSLWAQESSYAEYLSGNTSNGAAVHATPNAAKDSALASRYKVQMESGMSFTSMAGGSLSSAYVAPALSFQFTPRFTVRGGVIVAQNMASSLFAPTASGNGYGRYTGSFTSQAFFTEADYLVNKRLKITGSILYQTNNLSTQSDGKFKLNSTYEYSIGGTYKITDSFQVGFEVRQSNRPYNPYDHYLNNGSNRQGFSNW